jgi:Cu/Zn superoxide dismutase
MKKNTFFLLISFLAIFLLTACTSSPTQSVISAPTPTSNSVSVQSTADSASNQSSTTSSVSSQSNSVSTQSSTTDSGSVQSGSQQLFVSISNTSTQNSTSIHVHTLPSAAITIELSYCGQSSTQTKYADSLGEYTLNWTPNAICGGMATATVTASSNGQSSTSSTSFSVS